MRCRTGNGCLSRWRGGGGCWGEVVWFVVGGGEVCWAAGDGGWVTVTLGEEVGG
ncbi:hypothetical protein A2U01_0069847, partial [Trifolium medium]|nr:hypothetical protein [Trifolium medium]